MQNPLLRTRQGIRDRAMHTVTARAADAHAVTARRFILGMVLCGSAALALVATPGHASRVRHLRLLKSFPAADSVLQSSPDAVRLWLSETPEVPATKITVTSASGATVKLAPVKLVTVGAAAGTASAAGSADKSAPKSAPLTAALVTPIASGTYTVAWRTMSRDGHVVKGTFAFKVQAPAKR